jgi:hypothetical protein
LIIRLSGRCFGHALADGVRIALRRQIQRGVERMEALLRPRPP